MKKKNFRVAFFYEEGGVVTVKAEDEKEAEEIVRGKLDYDGLDSLTAKKKYRYTVVHRDWQIGETEETK